MTQPASNTGDYRQTASSETDTHWLNIRYKDGMIIKPEELEKELRYPGKVDENILDRIHGSMAGMALGDALGAHVEFRPQAFMEENPVNDLKGGGTWGLEKGQFTDDTSMALCLANSLVVRRDFIPYDQLVRYKWWYRFGYMSSTGKCFDIGKATKESLEEFERRQQALANEHKMSSKAIDYLSDPHILRQFNVNCSRSGVAGNGALMRLAPVPLFFYRYPPHAVEFSGISGEITHGDPIAYDACRYYGALIVAAIQGENKKTLLANSFHFDHKGWFNNEQLHPSIMEIIGGSYRKKGGHSEGIRGKGYIVRSLEAALWAFWSDGDSFKKGVLAAVNLGDDTDTTAAIYGQLAGAYYGYQKLPEKWRDAVYAKKFIECLSRWIVYEGERWQPDKSLALNNARSTSQGQSTPTVDQSNKPKSNITTRPPHPQPNSQQNSKASIAKGPGSECVPQSVQDNHSKSKNNATQSKSSNPTASSQDLSRTKGVSTWDESPDQNMSSTSPKSTQPKSNNPTARFQHPSYVKNGSNRNESQDRNMSLTSPKPTQPPDSKTAFRAQYFCNGKSFESMDDVCNWLRALPGLCPEYVNIFEEKGIDGYRLFNEINDSSLTEYGIKDKKDRDFIIAHINTLKTQSSTQNSTKKK